MAKLRIAFMNAKDQNNWKKDVAFAENAIQNAARRKADIIVFPEGYPLINKDEKGVRRGIKRLAKLTRENKIMAVVGSFTPNGIAAHVIAKGKEIGRQYKTHLFANNPRKIVPKDVEIFKWKGARFGVAICYSMFFPETAQLYRLKKADFILHPLMAVDGKKKYSGFWKSLLTIRSFESGLPIISSGLISKFQKSDGIGILALPNLKMRSLEFGKEGMLVEQIDINEWRKFRKKRSNPTTSGRAYITNNQHGMPIGDKNWPIVSKFIELQKKELKARLSRNRKPFR